MHGNVTKFMKPYTSLLSLNFRIIEGHHEASSLFGHCFFKNAMASS